MIKTYRRHKQPKVYGTSKLLYFVFFFFFTKTMVWFETVYMLSSRNLAKIICHFKTEYQLRTLILKHPTLNGLHESWIKFDSKIKHWG